MKRASIKFWGRSFPALVLLVLTSASWAFAQAASPKATPTPATTPTPAATPTPVPVQSLDDLRSRIRSILDRPQVRRGAVGVKIVSLNSGKVVIEQNAEKYFMPASNMKNFTVATAIERLTPDFRFATSVYAGSMPDTNGTVKGNLRIYGRGDVSFSPAFDVPIVPIAPSTAPAARSFFQALDRLADKIAAAGVKRIEGDIVADDSYFTGSAIPGSWEWDDLQWYYGTEVSALPFNDNSVDLSVRPSTVGSACTVEMLPLNTVYTIKNLCTTSAAGSPRTLFVTKTLGRNELEIGGTLPIGNAGFNDPIAVTRPAELFAALLKQRLELKGVTMTGGYRLYVPLNMPHVESTEIARLESPPLGLIAQKTMKPSQNMYTETLLRTLGEELRRRMQPTPTAVPADSAALGISEVKGFLTSIGIASDSVIQHDGSGMSRHDLVTPEAVVQLYSYMAKQSKFAQVWRDSLTIGGVDGTLANRFKGTSAQGNIRGKTGTLDQVSALSGYLTTVGGEEVIVSIIVNGVNTGRDRTTLIDDIVVGLANFNGKIDQ